MKKIVQKTRSGQFIAVYESAREASKETGICMSSITRSAKGIGEAGGYRFYWYTETTIPTEITAPEELQPEQNEDIP